MYLLAEVTSLAELEEHLRTSAYVSICQHTSAYVSIRQHRAAYGCISACGTGRAPAYTRGGQSERGLTCSIEGGLREEGERGA
jgi:hypothetical protein